MGTFDPTDPNGLGNMYGGAGSILSLGIGPNRTVSDQLKQQTIEEQKKKKRNEPTSNQALQLFGPATQQLLSPVLGNTGFGSPSSGVNASGRWMA